jgi:hypothetical protein
VDAIPPAILKTLVEETIESHIDKASLRALEIAEQSEREILLKIAEKYTPGSRSRE